MRSETVRRTLSQAFSSLDAVINLIGMLFFVLFVVSVLGLHLFWDCHSECRGDNCATNHAVYTRGNFRTLLNAYLSNYQLFSRDNWAAIMFEYMECMNNSYVAIYFCMIFTTCNFVLLPIFVSIFLYNFSLSEEQRRAKQVQLYVKQTYENNRKLISALDVKYINMGVRFLYKGSRVLKRVPVNLIDSRTISSDLTDADAADAEEEAGDNALGEQPLS